MNQIEIGSTVQLKSGGPMMTVEAYSTKMEAKRFLVKPVEDREQVVCQWFEEASLQSSIFPLSSLVIVDSVTPSGLKRAH